MLHPETGAKDGAVSKPTPKAQPSQGSFVTSLRALSFMLPSPTCRYIRVLRLSKKGLHAAAEGARALDEMRDLRAQVRKDTHSICCVSHLFLVRLGHTTFGKIAVNLNVSFLPGNTFRTGLEESSGFHVPRSKTVLRCHSTVLSARWAAVRRRRSQARCWLKRNHELSCPVERGYRT